MEDRHTVIASYSPAADGVSRSFAAVYDGHNGDEAAEFCCNRWACTIFACYVQPPTRNPACHGPAFRNIDFHHLAFCCADGAAGTQLVLLRKTHAVLAVGAGRGAVCHGCVGQGAAVARTYALHLHSSAFV